MAKGVMTWTPEADSRLFIAVLKIHDVKLKYAALAEAMGPDVTAKAISHRIARLKAIADADPSVPTMSSPVKSSPAGTSPVKSRGGKATPKGKRGRNTESPAHTKTGSKTPTGGNLSENDERDSETGVGNGPVNRVLQFNNVEKRMRIKEDSDDEEEDLVVKKQKS